MAKDAFNIDRLSDRISTLVPDFIQEDAPIFEQFLKAYFEFLEAEILVLESQGELDEILLEDDLGYLLVEPATVHPSPDSATSKLLYEMPDKNPFQVGDYIVGGKWILGEWVGTETVAKILLINGNTLYLETIQGNGFDAGETVTSRQGKQTGVVKTYKHNTILANNQLLNYSDVDQTTEEFLDYFQKDFIPSLDIDDTKDARLTIKNISGLYQSKGTKQSLELLLRFLYGMDAEIRYPIDETIQVSESGYNDQRRIAVVMDDVKTRPSSTDKVVQYELDGVTIIAESIVENVYDISTTSAQRAEYSLEITKNHFGTFIHEWPCTFVDRDGVTKVTGRVKGILSDYDETESSIYVAQEDGDSILLESIQGKGNITTSTTDKKLIGAAGARFLSDFKVGDTVAYKVGNTKYTNVIASIEDDTNATLTANGSATAENVDYFNDTISGGLLNEHQSFGSMYSLNDRLEFTSGKSGRDTVLSFGVVNGLRRGGVDKVYVEDGGTGYNGGDLVVFDNSNADGNAAEGVIGAIEDVAHLENRTEWGQFQITATANQTLFNGVDDNGKRILFNDNSVKVFDNGVLQVPYTDYTFKNDRVTFVNGRTAGHIIEIYTAFNNVLYEDGQRIQLNTTESYIRNVVITSPGTGYSELPQCFPGGYIYFDKATDIVWYDTLNRRQGYLEGEVVTGATSSATATIVRIDLENKRIIVKRTHTDVNQFTLAGEVITGGTSEVANTAVQCAVSSGTGAKLVAYSDEIGGVGSLNIQAQGYNYKNNQSLHSTSMFKMLVSTPTATLTTNLTFTGAITGSTGRVKKYDPNTHVLTFDTLDGHFLDNEVCDYNNIDKFTCLKFNPFQARGKVGGEGTIQRQLVTSESTLDESASNLHDGWLYQTHSYVVRVGESINKWRHVVKDLVHPAGHIFFGEVAVKEFVNPFDELTNVVGFERTKRFNFLPTIIIHGFPTYHIDIEEYGTGTGFNVDSPASGYVGDRRDDESNIILETSTEVYHPETGAFLYWADKNHMILEDAPDINAITEYLNEWEIYSTETSTFITEAGEIIVNEASSGQDLGGHFLLQDRLANEELATLIGFDESLIGNTHPFVGNGVDGTTVVVAPEGEPRFGPSSLDDSYGQRRFNIRILESIANAIVSTPMRIDTNPQGVSVSVEVENNGSQNVFKVNGVRNKHLELERDKTYYFTSSSTHPFRFSVTPDGSHNSGGTYTTGVSYGTTHTQITTSSSTPTTLYYFCTNHSGMGGTITNYTGNTHTSLSIDNVNNPSHSPYERLEGRFRMAESGIVLPAGMHQTLEEEWIVLEDGYSKFIIDDADDYNHLREEGESGSIYGGTFITEDGFTMALEDATITHSGAIEYLATERVTNSSNFTLNSIELEDGGALLDERTEGSTITSYVPFGSTIGDINKISEQQTYDISYYLLNNDGVLHTTDAKDTTNTEEDRIILESGVPHPDDVGGSSPNYIDGGLSAVLMETSKHSGLTISDMDSFLPNYRMKNFDLKENRRTDITWGSYVISSNITNSTLSSL